MDLESFLIEVTGNARENLPWLAAWAFGGLVSLAVTLLWLPRLSTRALRWIDDLLPGDFSDLHTPIGRWVSLGASLAVLLVVGTAVVSALVGDLGPIRDFLGAAGFITGRWLLSHVPKVIIVIVGGMFVQRLGAHIIPRVVDRQLRSRTGNQLESEVEKDVVTLSSVLTTATTMVVATATFFMVMAQVGIDLAPLLVGFGVVGIAVGFGAQNLVRDIFAGIFVILENQYRVNDVVKIAGIGGLVEDINLRRTVLRDLDYRQHFIPHGEIRTATNYTKDKSRVNMNVGVAYKEDLEQVIDVLNRVGLELSEDPEWGPLVLDPIQVLRVDDFADSAIEIKVLGETVPIRQWDIAGQYRLRVKKAFDELGIEIPFPHRTLYWGEGQPNIMDVRQNRPADGRGASRRDDGATGRTEPVAFESNPDPEGQPQTDGE